MTDAKQVRREAAKAARTADDAHRASVEAQALNDMTIVVKRVHGPGFQMASGIVAQEILDAIKAGKIRRVTLEY